MSRNFRHVHLNCTRSESGVSNDGDKKCGNKLGIVLVKLADLTTDR